LWTNLASEDAMAIRKATLARRAVANYRAKIDEVLQTGARRRLATPAVVFLTSIRRQLDAPVVRLSKSQRDTTDEILAKAFSDDPAVILEGEAIATLAALITYATGSVRVSSFDENVMANLGRRLDESVIAVSERLWRIVEEIKQKTHFGLPGELSPIDPDGVDEDQDSDGFTPERGEIDNGGAPLWEALGVDDDLA